MDNTQKAALLPFVLGRIPALVQRFLVQDSRRGATVNDFDTLLSSLTKEELDAIGRYKEHHETMLPCPYVYDCDLEHSKNPNSQEALDVRGSLPKNFKKILTIADIVRNPKTRASPKDVAVVLAYEKEHVSGCPGCASLRCRVIKNALATRDNDVKHKDPRVVELEKYYSFFEPEEVKSMVDALDAMYPNRLTTDMPKHLIRAAVTHLSNLIGAASEVNTRRVAGDTLKEKPIAQRIRWRAKRNKDAFIAHINTHRTEIPPCLLSGGIDLGEYPPGPVSNNDVTLNDLRLGMREAGRRNIETAVQHFKLRHPPT